MSDLITQGIQTGAEITQGLTPLSDTGIPDEPTGNPDLVTQGLGQASQITQGLSTVTQTVTSFLRQEELDSMRAAVLASLPTELIVNRYTPTPDGYGGQREDYQAIGIAAARVEVMLMAAEEVAGEQLRSAAQFRIYLPWNVDVTARDRLVDGALIYEIIGRETNFTEAVDCVVQAKRVE